MEKTNPHRVVSRRLHLSPIIKRILQLLSLVAVQTLLLFWSAGSFTWSAGWWYIGLYFAMLVAASVIMIPNRSEVIAERSKGNAGGKRWDLLITRLMAIPSLGLLIVAGLDERLGWTSPLPVWLRAFGGSLFLGGYAVVLWAMYSNQYFSQVVRIQTDRGHVAVAEGPYRFIRHPGYFGMLVSFFGIIFLLDSLFGLACFALYAVLIILRTSLEDRTLREELQGYFEYSRRIKYRLVPGLW